MSGILDNINLNNSAAATATNKTSSRPRSATISVHPDCIPKSNVHVSVSVSLSESLASISAWASQIVPGAPPASPSPRNSSFYSLSPKAPSRSPKIRHRRSLSATFLNFWDLPSAQPQTPAPKPVSPVDLVAQGYTSIFVHLPSRSRVSEYAESIPDSPSLYYKTKPPLFHPRAQPRPGTKSDAVEKKEANSVSLSRLRSFSFKGKKSKGPDTMGAFGIPPVPALPSHKSSSHPASPRSKAHHSKKPKSTPQSRYAAVLGPGGGAGALPLAQEVALSQMLDGGSLDANVRRVTERHARAAGTYAKTSSARDEVYRKDRKDRRPIEKREGPDRDGKPGAGISGVYHDAEGNMWWDEDEALEFAGLLHSSDAVQHSHNGQMPLSNSNIHNQNQEKEKRRGLLPRLKTSAKPPPTTALPEPPSWVPLHSPVASGKPGRKGSASDASSPDTDGEDPDLDPAYAVRPRDASNLFASGYSMNSEKERHLRRAPHGIEAFGVSPLDTCSNATANSGTRERKERKRPAPLTLPLPLPTPHVPTTGSTSTGKITSRPPTALSPPPPLPSLKDLSGPTREESEGRHEFFASAFAPTPEITTTDHGSAAATPASPTIENRARLTASLKASRRSSLTAGLSSLGLAVSGKAARRASVASASPTSPTAHPQYQAYPSPYSNGTMRGGNTRHALSKTSSRPSTASGAGPERSLKPKASRSRLAGFFKRG